MNNIDRRIFNLRKEFGITQAELGEHLGVTFQTISKWENGISMPDISHLPRLSEFFQVSVDQLLGLKPLDKRAYISRNTDSDKVWNKQLQYLKDTRKEFWNEDYFNFLIKDVWKLNEPIKIIDFGCGYGYLGTIILPLLPEGSSYTGIDISKNLIDEARQLFSNSKYKTEFINADINSINLDGSYDMAICQAFLRHLPNPKEILSKMINSLVKGGLIVTIEANRKLESSGLYIDGMSLSSIDKSHVLQKLWDYELENEGRDYSIGIKLPKYMSELGLCNIDVRLNDKVTFINPNSNNYEHTLDIFKKTIGIHKSLSSSEREDVISLLMNRGLSRTEAEKFLSIDEDVKSFLDGNQGEVTAIKSLCLMISSGNKK